MAETDLYNFQAPQFMESLSEVKLDDGADTFFDAADTAPESCEEEVLLDSNLPQNDNIKTSDENEKSDSDGNENDKSDSDEGGHKMNKESSESPKGNAENIDPEMYSAGPVTRLQRMSLKPNGPLGSKNNSKYQSVAEQIHKFHHSTPPRFKRKSAVFKSKSCKFLPTIAHSPQLRTKIRAARPSTAPTLITEEKPVIKPPVKKREIKGFTVKPVPKPPTVPVPFNLTMPGNRKQQEKKDEDKNERKEETCKEKKKDFATPKTLIRKPLPAKKKRLEIQGNKLTVKESWGVTGIKTIEKPNSTTKVVPFSFEKRNQERLLEKQRKLEEAKKQQSKVSAATNSPRRITRPSTASVTRGQ